MMKKRCDASDCWYKNNRDRGGKPLYYNQYVLSATLPVDAYIDFPPEGRSLPCIVSLCDVCHENQEFSSPGECSLCCESLMDDWLAYEDSIYCRMCFPESEWPRYCVNTAELSLLESFSLTIDKPNERLSALLQDIVGRRVLDDDEMT